MVAALPAGQTLAVTEVRDLIGSQSQTDLLADKDEPVAQKQIADVPLAEALVQLRHVPRGEVDKRPACDFGVAAFRSELLAQAAPLLRTILEDPPQMISLSRQSESIHVGPIVIRPAEA